MKPNNYDYTQAGFDGFLNRSIDNDAQINLDSPSQGPPSQAISFDQAQLSGAIGDTMRVGNISINGAAGNITANDGTNDFFILGDE